MAEYATTTASSSSSPHPSDPGIVYVWRHYKKSRIYFIPSLWSSTTRSCRKIILGRGNEITNQKTRCWIYVVNRILWWFFFSLLLLCWFFFWSIIMHEWFSNWNRIFWSMNPGFFCRKNFCPLFLLQPRIPLGRLEIVCKVHGEFTLNKQNAFFDRQIASSQVEGSGNRHQDEPHAGIFPLKELLKPECSWPYMFHTRTFIFSTEKGGQY